MKKLLLLVLLSVLAINCKSSKTATASRDKPHKNHNTKTVTYSNANSKEINEIIDYAKTFKGTRYKYGGTTKRGMDCSGLVVTAFDKADISLPRTTGDLSRYGKWIDVKEVQPGDLVFFATKKNSRKVNHVGIVTDSRPGYVEFIHSTTSRGVIVSKLSERYWYLAYVQARRIL